MLQPTYPIVTARLHLRPFVDTDLDDLFAFHSRPDVAQYLYWEARNQEETKAVLQQKKTLTQLLAAGARLVLAVVLPAAQKVIGEVVLIWQSAEHQQGEIGYVFNPAYGGHGYATEAAQAMLALAFDELGLHRICARCDGRNVASYRVMARLGMRREAHFVHNERFKGEWGDELIYALLRSEWAARQLTLANGSPGSQGIDAPS